MLEGEISEIDLVARLVELWREQFTGAIRFENDGIIKIVYFKGGDILSASTNDRSDSIDEILMRANKVTREHVKQALAKRKESETLGDALLNLGFITRKELTWARRVQVVGVIRSIAAWTTGSFTIVADYLPKRDEGTLFPLPQVLVELVVTDQDRATFERALDGGAAVFAKSADFDDVFRRLGLNDDAEAISAEIDGVKSAAEVASASRRDTFNAYKLIHALATLGILKRVGEAQSAAAAPQFELDDFAAAGVADAADMFNDPPPPPAPSPQFDFDEAEARSQPTLEVALGAGATAASAWDEPDEEPVAIPVLPPVPETPRRVAPAPIPMPEGSRMAIEKEPEKEQWGFDDAQLETSKRATTTDTASRRAAAVPPKEGRRYGLLVVLMVIFILAAAAYFGLKWWEGRQEAVAAPVVVKRPPRKAPAPAPVVAITTTQPVATTVTLAGEATNPVGTTTVVEKPNAPLEIKAPAPAPAEPTSTQALPAVVPKQGGTRYDEMARQYAANPTGNFTVQIQILCQQSNLDKAILTGGANVWFVPQAIGTRSCYRLFWGHYATRDEAQKALGTIPASLRDRSSAVKAVPR